MTGGPSAVDDWFAAPTMPGRLVTLRALAASDAAGILGAAADASVFEHLRVVPPATLAQAAAYLAEQLGARDRRLRVPFAQRSTTTGEVLGVTTYYDVDPAQRSLAIGHTWLGVPWQRSGVNTEAKLLLLARAFDDLGAVRVVWHTDIRNTRSQTAIERLGAEREGVLRKHRQRLDGSWRDTVQYALTDDDWPAARRRLQGLLR